jgi:F0F1-type ATP synthase membrane subunit b/b'
MNSLRFGAALAVAIALGLLGQADAQDETGHEAEAVCKNPQCPGIIGAWQQDLKACGGKAARIKELEGEVDKLKGKGQETADLQSRLDTCSAAGTDADKRVKEATDLVESLKKEVEDLKKLAAGTGDSEKLLEAIKLANAWKERADSIKDEGEAAKKEAADLKVETETAKKEMADLKAKIATLEASSQDDKDRGLKVLDQTPDTKTPGLKDPKLDEAGLNLEQKNKRLQEILDDTRRVLVEKEKEKEVSEGAIRQVLADLVDLLGKTFECSSFTVEMKSGARVLKGTVSEAKHRDDAWKMVLDSPLARLVHSSEIDVTASGARVCFVRTRDPGWLLAQSREKTELGATLFLRLALDPSVVQMLPRAADHSECERLGAVIMSLGPPEPRPSELAVWVRAGNGAVTQCYASPDGWKLRYRVPDRDGKWPAWVLLPTSQPGGGDRP